MPRLLLLLLVLGAAALPLSGQGPAPECFDAAGYDDATRTILCDCGCHPQSVHECACGRADTMRNEIHSEMAQLCLSGDELIALYVERHGQQIRIAPPATGFNLVAWIGPPVGAFLVGGLLLLTIRRWSRQRQVEPPPPAAVADDDAYRRRLRETLEGME